MDNPVPTIQPSAKEFLDAAYTDLGYDNGALLPTIGTSELDSVDADDWLEKGNWLELGKKINAEKIFFVRNDPVIVFHPFDTVPSESEILKVFRQTWCMTRSQYLYLAFPGELRAYGLRQSPPQSTEDPSCQLVYETIQSIAEVSVKLNEYRREQLEAGYFPEDRLFGKPDEQADKRLINDLKEVRRQLREIDNLKIEFAHALIGRSIFIRYLEDRQVLSPTYFEQVAHKHQRKDWLKLLSEAPPQHLIQDEKWQDRRYYKVLTDKEFTYALFKQLAEDFNGDLFPKDANEEQAISIEHLDKLRKFLLGDSDPIQPELWLWAYDFEIVPIELISSIYEEFYKNEQDDNLTHYTPSVLVEFVLSQLLPRAYLETNPDIKILDPACGSGIFLVETFRRLVRYKTKKKESPLNSVELREILRDQIRGIELNSNATYVAAFSLYLALLHYQEPSDILAQIEFPQHDNKPLPHLIYNPKRVGQPNQYEVLVNSNAFALTAVERSQLKEFAEANPRRTTLQQFLEIVEDLPFEANSVDVIVGNPPWGSVKPNSVAIQWCKWFAWPIGDNELSQAFIARALNLLKPEGECGLLVSTGIFLKNNPQSSNNREFRQKWMHHSTLKTVVNFIHSCELFFEGSNAPFAFVHFQTKIPHSDHAVNYWSSKRTKVIERKLSVVLSLSDIQRVRQTELLGNEQLWKTYWWGNHRDASLVTLLQTTNSPLISCVDKDNEGNPITGRGFEKTGDRNPADWLANYRYIPPQKFKRYGTISERELLTVPTFVHRRGNRDIYTGWRLLTKRGIIQRNNLNGRIETRLDNTNFSFQNSIHGIRIDDIEDWQRKVLIGIIWSSLARYYFFMTSGSWTIWHKELHLWQLEQLPIRFPNELSLRNRIVKSVDQLRNWDTTLPLFNQSHGAETLVALERELDGAIFDLYELNEAERDLVLDMCETGLELFYRHSSSNAIRDLERYPESRQGFITDLSQHRELEKGLHGYLYAFVDMWQSYLEPDAVFRWQIVRPDNDPMLAVIFTAQAKDDALPPLRSEKEMWANLNRIAESSKWQINSRIYIDGLVRLVTDDGQIIIIKRNERRLWTRSQAREDAEATFVQAMRLQEGR